MLENKVILVTGANRGIGLATAQVCIGLGATVLLAGRDEVQLELVAEQLGESAIAMCYDVTDEEQVKQAFGHIKQHIGHLDGLVNNAGVMHNAPLAMTPLDTLQQQLNVNTIAAFQHIQLASRLMRKPGRGSIVNLCSIVGEQGATGQSAYAASKAALTGITKSLAKELAPQRICVNAVAPGFIDTELHDAFTAEQRENIVNTVGLGRVGQPREVADLISFLLSEHASYITGQIIGIDGGMRL